MNEQLQQLATQGFGTALQYLQATEAFVAEQAPLLIQEVLAFGLAKTIAWACLWGVLIAIDAFVSWYLYKTFCRIDPNNDENVAPLFIGSSLAIIPGICLFGELLDICKIVFAPRLYLIEKFQTFIN